MHTYASLEVDWRSGAATVQFMVKDSKKYASMGGRGRPVHRRQAGGRGTTQNLLGLPRGTCERARLGASFVLGVALRIDGGFTGHARNGRSRNPLLKPFSCSVTLDLSFENCHADWLCLGIHR
jgi:hypothetical protein